jgi:H+-transporting ATPase
MLIAAAVLSLASDKVFDFYFIAFLVFFNFLVTFWQERKADDSIKKLSEHLQVRVKTLRDGKWTWLDSTQLVPGDVTELASGDIIPADVKILEAENFTVNDAALTGESLPKEKHPGDTAFSGSYPTTGLAVAEVRATGKNTYFGKTLLSVERASKKSLLENDILTISKFLSVISIACVIILTLFLLTRGMPPVDILTLDISLMIAGIPVAMPTVMTLIISQGILELAKKGVVVRRLSSLEDLANVDVLFTDKTGTLTKNEIGVEKIICYNCSEEELLSYAFLAAVKDDRSILSQAIVKKTGEMKADPAEYDIINFVPADSERKRSTAVASLNGKTLTVTIGAAQVVQSICLFPDDGLADRLEKDIGDAAKKRYRTLAVAYNYDGADEKDMILAGLLLLSDPLREDAKEVIGFLQHQGVDVRMLTGDNKVIGDRIGEQFGLKKEEVYCEVLPRDKYDKVREAMRTHIVAVTGDGINDIMAVKYANIGIAVSNTVDALKSSADIVLVSPGVSVIKDAIIEARRIFARLYSYSLYRLSESFRIVITILILGILYGTYPITPVQLILLAFLNDVPIISLAFNRVKITEKPSRVNVQERFILSSLFGLTGIVNSILLFFIMTYWLHLPGGMITTIFFLKLTVSGHMLIYVSHTAERWYKFLPSREVIIATIGTQLIATYLAVSGTFMDRIPLSFAVMVWIWTLSWMQVSEMMKDLQKHITFSR